MANTDARKLLTPAGTLYWSVAVWDELGLIVPTESDIGVLKVTEFVAVELVMVTFVAGSAPLFCMV